MSAKALNLNNMQFLNRVHYSARLLITVLRIICHATLQEKQRKVDFLIWKNDKNYNGVAAENFMKDCVGEDAERWTNKRDQRESDEEKL